MTTRFSSNRSRSPRWRALLAAAALVGIPAPASVAGAGDLMIRAKRAFTGRGEVVAPATIVIRAGRIVSVSVTAPEHDGADAPVLDVSDMTVTPGFVDARSTAGLPRLSNDESEEVSPSLRALDLVDAGSIDFERALRGGVTTAVVSPGGRAVIGGLAAALKTAAGPGRERVVSPAVGLVITLGEEPTLGNHNGWSRFMTPLGLHFRRPGDRMGVVAAVRRAFDGASRSRDVSSEVLRSAQGGSLPVMVGARSEADLRTAMELGASLGWRPVLVGAVEAHRVAEQVALGSAGVILGPSYELPRSLAESLDGADFRLAAPAILDAAGVRVVIATGEPDPGDLLRERAVLAVRHGMSAAAALAAITSVPATLLGLDARVGALVPGRDGDVVVLDGDPLELTSRIVAVIVQGRIAWSDGLRSPGVSAAPMSPKPPVLRSSS